MHFMYYVCTVMILGGGGGGGAVLQYYDHVKRNLGRMYLFKIGIMI